MLVAALVATLVAAFWSQPDLAPLVQGATTDRAACMDALNANHVASAPV